MMKIPELLSPAGNMDALRAALHFGANAVYGGMKRYGLRSFAGNFDESELAQAVAEVHAAGANFYVTMNAYPWDDELEGFIEAAGVAREIGVDAVIVSDPGAILLLRKRLPDLRIHVSTQANTLNTPSAEMYRDLGCERVILAREMSLKRIAVMAEKLKGSIQLETFVHGASCVSYSGRCLLSAYLTGRSGNRGACAQPCRWEYAVVEKKRPGVYMPVSEDENGTYLFSARDLCLMPILPDLIKSGISSLKIEGRMKTEYYVAVVTGVYRRALDMLADNPQRFTECLPDMLQELQAASHRLSDTGFMLGNPEEPAGAEGFHQSREYLGRVLSSEENGEWRMLLKNRFYAGDELELMTPSGVQTFRAESFVREKTGERLDTLGIAGEIIRIRLPAGASKGDMLRGPVRNHRE